MSFSIVQQKFEKVEEEFEKELLKEIERLAKLVIETIPKAKSFCMAMGSASFHCQWREWEEGDEDDFWECDDNLNPEELSDGNSYAEDLATLFEKWDDKFHLTGYPMKIDRDHVTGKLITTSDW